LNLIHLTPYILLAALIPATICILKRLTRGSQPSGNRIDINIELFRELTPPLSFRFYTHDLIETLAASAGERVGYE
jgi:hypothetical protein